MGWAQDPAEKIYAAVFEDNSFTKVAPTNMVVGDTIHMAIINKMETAAFVKPTKCWLSSSTDPADNTNKEVVINNGCAKNSGNLLETGAGQFSRFTFDKSVLIVKSHCVIPHQPHAVQAALVKK